MYVFKHFFKYFTLLIYFLNHFFINLSALNCFNCSPNLLTCCERTFPSSLTLTTFLISAGMMALMSFALLLSASPALLAASAIALLKCAKEPHVIDMVLTKTGHLSENRNLSQFSNLYLCIICFSIIHLYLRLSL